MQDKGKRNKMIFLVSDNISIIDLIRNNVKKRGWSIKAKKSSSNLKNEVNEKIPAVIIIDDTLESISAVDVSDFLSSCLSKVPQIIIAGSKDTAYLSTFMNGKTVDFVFKPLSIKILMNRLNILSKKKSVTDNKKYKNGGIFINDINKYVFVNGKKLKLSPTEYLLLKYLTINRGQVLSRERILNNVWGYESNVIDRNVDVYIGYLRHKLKNVLDEKAIITRPSFGYMMKDMKG